jgi:AcrR family transcriptional regulator
MAMTSPGPPVSFTRPRAGGRAGKLPAIIQGARTVFGRDGYARASIEAIAAEAGVSTRTIYNHFEGKEQLFAAILHDSATRVADSFIDKVRQQLTGADARADLIALGLAFAARRTEFPEHFAMIDQFRTDAVHLPPVVAQAWEQAGPMRVQEEVARQLWRLGSRGLLRVGSPSRAALHFMALVTADITNRPYGAPALAGEQITEAVTSGVDAFVDGYGILPRDPAAD